MKTNQITPTKVVDRREVSLSKMLKAIDRLQKNLKNIELESNGNNSDGSIRYIGRQRGEKAILDFAGCGFNMTITLSQPTAGKGIRS